MALIKIMKFVAKSFILLVMSVALFYWAVYMDGKLPSHIAIIYAGFFTLFGVLLGKYLHSAVILLCAWGLFGTNLMILIPIGILLVLSLFLGKWYNFRRYVVFLSCTIIAEGFILSFGEVDLSIWHYLIALLLFVLLNLFLNLSEKGKRLYEEHSQQQQKQQLTIPSSAMSYETYVETNDSTKTDTSKNRTPIIANTNGKEDLLNNEDENLNQEIDPSNGSFQRHSALYKWVRK